MKKEPRLLSFAVGFHDAVVAVGSFLYMSMFPLKLSTTPENARTKMEDYAKIVREKAERKFTYKDMIGVLPEHFADKNLEEKLSTFGVFYIPRKQFDDKPILTLWNAAKQYDLKGIIPAPNEKLRDFVYRANSLLYIHKHLRVAEREPKIKFDQKKREIELEIDLCPKFITQEDKEEANKRIPYYMDLTWVASYVKEPGKMLIPALGLTFTLPNYNGMNFIQMRSEYDSREQFMNVLSHEMVHAGTVYLDIRPDYLETKAYHVGKGSLLLGEYVVAFNASPNFLIRTLKFITETFFFIPVPDNFLRIYPKIKNTVQILDNTSTFREVEGKLHELYGAKGGYVLGRLNGDEIEEFRDTNNIPARISLKKDLKWRIMRTNLEKI